MRLAQPFSRPAMVSARRSGGPAVPLGSRRSGGGAAVAMPADYRRRGRADKILSSLPCARAVRNTGRRGRVFPPHSRETTRWTFIVPHAAPSMRRQARLAPDGSLVFYSSSRSSCCPGWPRGGGTTAAARPRVPRPRITRPRAPPPERRNRPGSPPKASMSRGRNFRGCRRFALAQARDFAAPFARKLSLPHAAVRDCARPRFVVGAIATRMRRPRQLANLWTNMIGGGRSVDTGGARVPYCAPENCRIDARSIIGGERRA